MQFDVQSIITFWSTKHCQNWWQFSVDIIL